MFSLRGIYHEHIVHLEKFATEQGFLHLWVRKSFFYLVLVTVAWAINMFSCAWEVFSWSKDTDIISMVHFFFSLLLAGMHFALVHCMCHVFTFLGLMLDNYSSKSLYCMEWSLRASSWNIVQALLSRVSCAVGCCFLAVQTSGTIGFLCFAVQLLDDIVMSSGDKRGSPRVLTMIPDLPILMISAFAFVLLILAASLTETCLRLPTVVNTAQVRGGNAINPNRLRAVAFIQNCKAGFSVKGSQVNATVLLNYCYLCGAVVCGIFTTGLSMARSHGSSC